MPWVCALKDIHTSSHLRVSKGLPQVLQLRSRFSAIAGHIGPPILPNGDWHDAFHVGGRRQHVELVIH